MLKQEKITAEVLHEFIDVNEFTAALDSVMDGELPDLIISNGHVNIGVIFLFIGNSHDVYLFQTNGNLFITQ